MAIIADEPLPVQRMGNPKLSLAVAPLVPPRLAGALAPLAAPMLPPEMPAGAPGLLPKLMPGLATPPAAPITPRLAPITLPDANSPTYKPLSGGSRLLANLSQFAGVPTKNGIQPLEGLRAMGQQAIAAPQERYNRDVQAAKDTSALGNTQSEEALRAAQIDELAREKNIVNSGGVGYEKQPDGTWTPIGTAKPEKPETVESGGVGYEKQPDGTWKAIGTPKAQTYSNPFEAFAYGSPEEKQAAQDFLDLEKRAGARYEKPGEVEQRYALYQRDPDAYKAMYGDRGGAQDQETASKMLNYFQRQRDSIQKDWQLTPEEQQQKLTEIDQLEQPYRDAMAASGGGSADRVTVTSPDGHPGTIPRSQLKAAQKKGYKVGR